MNCSFVVVLLLMLPATAAYARNWEAYHCGVGAVRAIPGKYFGDDRMHYFKLKEPDRELPARRSRIKGETLLYNGKPCREFTTEEYERCISGSRKRLGGGDQGLLSGTYRLRGRVRQIVPRQVKLEPVRHHSVLMSALAELSLPKLRCSLAVLSRLLT